MSFDIEHHDRGIFTRAEGRASLKRYKKTERYRIQLQAAIREGPKLEAQATTAAGKREARKDKMAAMLESEFLAGGEPTDPFSGLIRLPDPLRQED